MRVVMPQTAATSRQMSNATSPTSATRSPPPQPPAAQPPAAQPPAAQPPADQPPVAQQPVEEPEFWQQQAEGSSTLEQALAAKEEHQQEEWVMPQALMPTPRGDKAARDMVSLSSIQDLLTEQVNYGKKMIETSHAIKDRLQKQGLKINLPDVHVPAAAAAPEANHQPRMSLEETRASLTEPLLGKKNGKKQPETGSKWGAGIVFPDHQQLKKMLTEEEYNVEDLYKVTGPWQEIARNSTFQMFMFAVIVLNALWIGISTDYNKADLLTDAPWWIQIGENVFCAIFFFEIVVRFMSFERKCDAFSDGWFCFDFTLVSLMVWETWLEVAIVALMQSSSGGDDASSAMIFRIFRVSRLTRISRVGRISRFLREVPELAILTKALLIALRSVGATLLLLIVSIYVFAIFFTQMLGERPDFEGQFDTVLHGMNTLLVQGILADQADLINNMLATGSLYYWVILLYMLVAALTVANMLIGVICDLISKVSDEKQEQMKQEFMEKSIKSVIFEIDTDHNDSISKSEFGKILGNEKATKLLSETGVDVFALLSYADVIFEDDTKELQFKDFMEIVMGFRDSDNSMKVLCEMKSFMKDQLAAADR